MRALVFEKQGLENLTLRDVDKPSVEPNKVLVRVKMAGVNPIDRSVVTILSVKPLPHIPSAEFCGVVEKIGEQVTGPKVGDRVVVYNRLFDGDCRFCLSGREMVCERGGP